MELKFLCWMCSVLLQSTFLLVFPHSFLLSTKLTRIIHSRDGCISVLVEKSWQFSQVHAVRRAEGLGDR